MKLLLVVLIFLALVCAAKSLLSVNPSETTLSSSVSSVQASRLSSNFVVGNDSPGLIEKQNSVSYGENILVLRNSINFHEQRVSPLSSQLKPLMTPIILHLKAPQRSRFINLPGLL